MAGAVKVAKTRKAPGPNNLPNEVVRLAFACDPKAFTNLYNACLREGTFPDQWKTAKLTLLPKGKPEDMKFRPLCLLNTTGKIFEKIIVKRLEEHLDGRADGSINQNQYGFRRGRCTTDAIIDLRNWIQENSGPRRRRTAISLDIKNAFNTASWPRIMEALRDMETPAYLQRIIESYLSNRKLMFETTKGTETAPITLGVPQGSVLGPLLWNVMFNAVLGIELPDGTKTMCYANDPIILATGNDIEQTWARANEATDKVTNWMEAAGLEVAHHKTVAILIGGPRPPKRGTEIRIKGHRIPWSDKMKYLGVIIDRKVSFTKHVKYATQRAAQVATSLTRLVPSTGGPRQARRRRPQCCTPPQRGQT